MANEETTRNRGPAVPDSPGPGGGAAGAGSFPAEAKLLLIQEQARTGEPLRRFCAAHGITTTTFCAWKRRYEAEGAAGLEPRPNPRNASGAHRGAFPPEQRREAVEAWLRSGMRQADFARLWGVGKSSLSKWIRRYQEGGPPALEDQPRRRPCPQRLPCLPGRSSSRVPIPSAMPAPTLDPWSAEQSAATLRQLRRDYPGYTANELYAICCHVHGRIPLDSSGRAQIDAWKRQAERDGRHVEGGFRVSTSLFGRARFAKPGVPKPPRKISAKTPANRKEPAISAAAVTGISGQALALARSYHRTAKALEAILA